MSEILNIDLLPSFFKRSEAFSRRLPSNGAGKLLPLLLALVIMIPSCGFPGTGDTQESGNPQQEILTASPVPSLLEDDLPPEISSETRQLILERMMETEIAFTNLSIADGLSQSVVTSMIQDSRGFMWFGTQEGLNRFDGHEFVIFKHEGDDPSSLSDNFILSLLEDRSGNLWIGTNGGGLNRYQRATESFIRYAHDPDDPSSLSSDIVNTLHEDHQGVLWLGTDAGLNRFVPDQGVFTQYLNDPSDATSLSADAVISIHEDSQRILWVGTVNGLNRMDRDSGAFTRYQHIDFDHQSLAMNIVQCIYEDRMGNLWIGTYSGGLDRFDRESGHFVHHQHNPYNNRTVANNSINTIFEDDWGVLWVGTHGGGLDIFNRDSMRFLHHQHDPGNSTSLGHNQVISIYQDQAGVLWFGTFGGGVSRFDPMRLKFGLYRADPGNYNSLNSNSIWGFAESASGVLWIATNGGGLNRFDRQYDRWRHFLHDPEDPSSLSNDIIYSLFQDREGILWIGTGGSGVDRFDPRKEQFEHIGLPGLVLSVFEDREGMLWIGSTGGLFSFDRATQQFTSYPSDPADDSSLSSDAVSHVTEDQEGQLWISTITGGINRFDRQTEQFRPYRHDPENSNSLIHDMVISIYADTKGILWIATAEGLDRFDPTAETFVHYGERDGLPGALVYGILEDDQGYLWLSTNAGLSQFDPQNEIFKNYDVADGLQSNEFNQGALFKSTRGEMFFGGLNGFNYFFPDQINRSSYIPPIVITNFELFNEPVGIGGGSPLQHSITETSEIELDWTQDFFSFEFASLHYSLPDRNQYAYMMQGLDKDWNEVGTRRFAGYTSVPPGEYTFRVRGTNSDGIWNQEGASIGITITPPFWQTWPFRFLIAALIIGGSLGGFALRIRYIEGQRKQLAIQVDERTKELRAALVEVKRAKEAAEAANRAKSVFLANMSHELRTPLNAILGFSQLMLSEPLRPQEDVGVLSVEQKENLRIIARSGEHLLNLINDVLEMSKIEAGRASLNQRNFDLFRVLDGVDDMFILRAEQKGLTLSLEVDPEVPQYVWGDEGKLRQLLMNLIGNAVKFTQQGSVELRVHVAEDSDYVPVGPSLESAYPAIVLGFEVVDTGSGIPVEDLEVIFDPFVQAASGEEPQEGTGLGLSISQQFARLMGGEITASSELGVGSTFEAMIPLRLGEQPTVDDRGPSQRAIGLEPGQPVYRILVVDDKESNRRLLVKLLEPLGFDIREAIHGKHAIDIWEDWEPHVIFMDMRMPVMDGYEATRKIKSTTKGQATVIIAITASALEEDRLIILSEGCDGYMRKPFRGSELYEKLSKHLGVRILYEEVRDPGLVVREDASREVEALKQELAKWLAELEGDWVTSLERAAILGELARIDELLEQERTRHPEQIAMLATLAEKFDHETILKIIHDSRELK
ncbi:MAG TPA: response regulator [Anaerolineae bacterium]|nr:response regulator [Anaerolineae bacterium]